MIPEAPARMASLPLLKQRRNSMTESRLITENNGDGGRLGIERRLGNGPYGAQLDNHDAAAL